MCLNALMWPTLLPLTETSDVKEIVSLYIFIIQGNYFFLAYNGCLISVFHHKVDENCALLGCYAASSGKVVYHYLLCNNQMSAVLRY